MKKHSKILIFLLVLTMVLAGVTSAYAAIPEPTGEFYVADYADVLTDSTESIIIEKNAELEYFCDGAQIVVVTVDFLDGMNIEDYAYKLFNDWQIGDSGSNNGILLLLTIGEENYWCMTGKGLENKLTAGEIDDILWYNLEDYFASGDYDQGVQVTFDLLCAELHDIYNVSGSSGGDGYSNGYYEDELTAMDWIFTLIVFAVIIIITITIISIILGSIRSRRYKRTYYDPYVPQRPYSGTRPSRRVYIPTPVHKPYRPAHRPNNTFGGGFGSSSSRPATHHSSPRPSRPSSFGGGSSFSGGSRSSGIGRGGGGMSRGGGAGRRGR